MDAAKAIWTKIWPLFIIVSLLLGGLAAAASPVVYDTSAGANNLTCTAGSLSWSHTTTGTNRLLVVAFGGVTLASATVTYAGTSMTRLLRTTSSDTEQIQIFYLVNPALGSNTVTVSTSQTPMGVSMSFSDVALAPITGETLYVATPGVPVSSRATSTGAAGSNDMVIGFVTATVTQFDPTPVSASSGQTIRQTNRRSCAAGESYLHAATVQGSSMNWAYSPSVEDAAVIMVVRGTLAGGDDSGGGGGGVPGAPFPSPFQPACGLGVVDWIRPIVQPGSRTVGVNDQRREAALVTFYNVNWGDRTAFTYTTSPFNHTYAKDGIYTITIAVQYRSGAIEVFVSDFIDLRGNNCSMQNFVRNIFPVLSVLAGLCVVGAFIVGLSRRRIRLKLRKLLERYLLGIAVVAIGIIVATAIYAAANGIPF